VSFSNRGRCVDIFATSISIPCMPSCCIRGVSPHFSPGGVRFRKGVGYMEKSSNGQKYSVLIKHAYDGSG
jgi:hypothetical protein